MANWERQVFSDTSRRTWVFCTSTNDSFSPNSRCHRPTAGIWSVRLCERFQLPEPNQTLLRSFYTSPQSCTSFPEHLPGALFSRLPHLLTLLALTSGWLQVGQLARFSWPPWGCSLQASQPLHTGSQRAWAAGQAFYQGC